LDFTCDKTVEGNILLYKLSGTNKDQFNTTSESITVTAIKKVALIKDPNLTIVLVKATSNSANLNLNITCPEIGRAFIFLAPKGSIAPEATYKEVIKSYEAY
jgi:hypothetical protein